MTYSIKATGVADNINMVKKLQAEFPPTAARATRKIATEIQKRARFHLSQRVWLDTSPQPGRLAKSITVRPESLKGKKIGYVVGPDRRIARYAHIIETGITGMHAVPIRRNGSIVGFYTRPGGMLPKSGGRFYMRDAFFDVFGRAGGIALKEIDKYVARVSK